jgi:hypothetical protein
MHTCTTTSRSHSSRTAVMMCSGFRSDWRAVLPAAEDEEDEDDDEPSALLSSVWKRVWWVVDVTDVEATRRKSEIMAIDRFTWSRVHHIYPTQIINYDCVLDPTSL